LGANDRALWRSIADNDEAIANTHLQAKTPASGRERLSLDYGSEGWGFESLRARNTPSDLI